MRSLYVTEIAITGSKPADIVSSHRALSMQRVNLLWGMVGVIASAALMAIAVPRSSWGVLAWVVLVPLVLVMQRVSPWRAGLLGTLFGAVSLADMHSWQDTINTRDLSLRIWHVGERTLLVILVFALSPCVATAEVKENRLTAPVVGSSVPLAAQPATHTGSLPPVHPAPTATTAPGLPSFVNVPSLVFRGVELPNTMVTPTLSYIGMTIPDHVNTPGLRFMGRRVPGMVPR